MIRNCYIICLGVILALTSPRLLYGQEQFIDFLKSEYLPNCFNGLNHDQVEQLVQQFEIQADWTTFRVKYMEQEDLLYLYSSSPCDDIDKVHIKHLVLNGKDHMFMYKQRVPNSNTYGRLKVFILEDGVWMPGKKIDITWKQFFPVTNADLHRLERADQFPKYLLKFEADFILFEIPWKLYTFGEGSETDGFAMSNATQPIRLPYHLLLR